jgi:hypothetical protein
MANLVTINVNELTALKGRITKAQQAVIDTATQQLDEYGRLLRLSAQSEAPQSGKPGESGTLRDSIRYKVTGRGTKNVELRLEAGNKARPEVVVKTVLFGSKPHIIKPKRRGYPLRWAGSDGRPRFAFRVRHPGTNPNNFFARAWSNTAAQRRAMVNEIGRITVSKITR